MSGPFPPVEQIDIRFGLLFDAEELTPAPPKFSYGTDVYVSSGSIKLSASATDEIINFPSLPSVRAIIFVTDPFNLTNISLKINGSSNARAVSPILGITDEITSLTGTNTSVSEDIFIRWAAVTEYARE